MTTNVCLKDSPHVAACRIDYDSGRLEIVSPRSRHGRYDGLIRDLVLVYCDFFKLNFEGFTTVTWKRKSLLKGVDHMES